MSEARRQDRRQALLDSARALFADQGFDDTSMAEIARAAQVSDGLTYRYFADKRALLAAVLERLFEDLIDSVEAAVARERGFRKRLGTLIETHLDVFANEPALCRLFLHQQREASTYLGSPLHRLTKRYTDLLMRIANDAKATGEVAVDTDLRMLRDLVFGGMEHLGWHHLSGGADMHPAHMAERLADMIVRGVGKS